MRPTAHLLPGGRLHLQHGPSDLIIWAEGARDAAYAAAARRFETIIAEVMAELGGLRAMISPLSPRPTGAVARRMVSAASGFAECGYVTPMAAVAGSIADEVLAAMLAEAPLSRAYVNNGGDIALHLAPGTAFRTAMKGHDGADLGRIDVRAEDDIGGIATSGRHGRSHSLGIADSVTVLAASAAGADVAATLIANAVDLPGHPAITRRAASDLDDTSDLGDLPVVTGCGALRAAEVATALGAGLHRARHFKATGRIAAAGLFLQGAAVTTGSTHFTTSKDPLHVSA